MKAISISLFICMWFQLGTTLHAQKRLKCENVKIHEGFALRGDPCEPSIMISPADKDVVVAGSILKNVHRSNDGGRIWKTDQLYSSHGVYGDPCIVSDAGGNFYYFHLGDPDQQGWRSSRLLESIVVQRSEDGGASWNDGAAIGRRPPKDQDKEWAAVDQKTGVIYCTWTEFDEYGSKDPQCMSRILFSRSEDKGETWSDAISISEKEGNCLDGDHTTEGAVPSVDKDGNLYVAWGVDEKIYFDKSTDGGRTWLPQDRIIANQPGGWEMDVPPVFRVNGMPVTATDLSDGKYANSVYVCWADTREGEADVNIYFIYSRDQGETWSEPLLVNTKSKRKNQFFPWMCVDPVTGKIYIVYYDSFRVPQDHARVILAVSDNGGKKFKQYRISDSSFELPASPVFFGDYNNISAYDGRVRPIWTHYAEGKLSIWTALIDN